MSGTKKQINYFWICERSRQTQATDNEIIMWQQITDKYKEYEKQVALRDAEKMAEIWLAFYCPKKTESIKKRLFRRFLPWKKK